MLFTPPRALSAKEVPVAAEAPATTGEQEAPDEGAAQAAGSTGTLGSPSDVALHAVNDEGTRYAFSYGDEEFAVAYEPDNWKVYDSYKITNHDDLVLICQALIDEHPIHGRDLDSYRTAEDMAFEWEQHNFAYEHLPEGSAWRRHAKDVDLDPYDQGLTYWEMYERRRNAAGGQS